jgi:hypothetical protein
MNTKTLSQPTLSVIDHYLHFKVGNAACSVPYFNNKTIRARAALRVNIGKGNPEEIREEISSILVKDRIDPATLSGETLKKALTDNNIGIDCSAFAYYTLNAESEERGIGRLDRHIHFINCRGLIGKMRCALRPIENCDVATFAADENSQEISIANIKPGDIITMIGGPDNSDRDHILVVHQIQYQESVSEKIYYVHAIAYPEDGVYGTGIKEGSIEVTDPNKPITQQIWVENGKTGEANRLLVRAQKSQTSVRRLTALL